MKLQSKSSIDWILNIEEKAVVPAQVHFGKGAQPIQIAVAEAQAAPSRTLLKGLFGDRKGRLQISVIVAVVHGPEVYLFGPDADSEILIQKLATATSFLNSVLDQENGILAYQRAISVRRSLQTTDMPGFTNNGLFASHYVRTSVTSHPKWEAAQEQSLEIKGLRNRALIDGLGFEVTATPSRTLLLSAKGSESRVVAILLESNETFETKSDRFQASPIEWGLGIATQQGAPWVVAMRDSQIRLYPAKDGVGVGQKSQVETYFEVDLLTIDEEKAGLLSLIFSADALSEHGTAEELLKNSHKFASDLGVRLRERVYEFVVPELAKEVAHQLDVRGHALDAKGLQLAYELTLRILFRLLFQAYAEDRGLLPSGRNELFDSNSIKHWADHLLNRDPALAFGESATIWFDLRQIWDAIDQGNPDMQIPAYNGGLFGTDQHLHPEGHLINSLAIPDNVMGPALRALVIDDSTEDGVAGPVDFRSLSVREFGTIYEGLLESSLSVASQNLTVDRNGAWVPAREGEEIFANSNEIYFHSASGERKATGSYYTPIFLVDHLVEKSIQPALDQHFIRVGELLSQKDQAAAYKAFFDFRVADLAMGSAHFLVAAIDKIEAGMRSFLIQPSNAIIGVEEELLRLENSAKSALGQDQAAYSEIERSSLLRRQIARRCIYGLDINPLAVELSRLAIWIHTFVPGLPMSSLEHNLVCANSLTGIGSVEEGLNALIPGRQKHGTSLFDSLLEDALENSKQLLVDVANADEANKAEAKAAAQIAKGAREVAKSAKIISDIAIANRNGVISSGAALTETDLEDLHALDEVQDFVVELMPAHMPYLFPEVFLRHNPGFDVLVGNPPWEKVKVEEQVWWGVHYPGLRGLPQKTKIHELRKFRESRPDLEALFDIAVKKAETIRSAILKADFPGIGQGGDPNLFHAFAWRFTQLLRRGGRTGVVLPRGAMTTGALYDWRNSVLNSGSFDGVIFVINNRNWLFDNIHGQTEIALCVISKDGLGRVRFTSRLNDLSSFEKNKNDFIEIEASALNALSTTLALPVFPGASSRQIFEKLSQFSSIGDLPDSMAFRPTREMDGTKQKSLLEFVQNQPEDSLPVWSGAAFNIWDSQFGDVYAYALKTKMVPFLKEKHLSSISRKNSVHYLQPESPLPHEKSRLVFRDTSSGTNRRTVIVCLAPPEVALIHRAPYLVFKNPNAKAEAFALGVMSSLIFDWVARCWVEGTFSFEILERLPFPEAERDSKLGQRIIEISANLADRYRDNSNWFKETGSTRLEASFEEMVAELDGLVALAYKLQPSDLKTVFETFHPGWSDPTRLKMALKTMDTWSEQE